MDPALLTFLAAGIGALASLLATVAAQHLKGRAEREIAADRQLSDRAARIDTTYDHFLAYATGQIDALRAEVAQLRARSEEQERALATSAAETLKANAVAILHRSTAQDAIVRYNELLSVYLHLCRRTGEQPVTHLRPAGWTRQLGEGEGEKEG